MLRIDLVDVMHVKAWRWFETRVAALLSVRGTALFDFFHPSDDPAPEVEGSIGQ